MTTAIKLPKALLESAEEFARQKGISLDELHANALQQYLRARQTQDVTVQLDQIYSEQSNSLDPLFVEIQARSLEPDAW